MASATQKLLALGQSVWLDYLSRDLLETGRLAEMIEAEQITGITSNPTIFEKAISASSAYDADLERLGQEGERDPYAAFLSLAGADVRAACDLLRPVFERSGGRDGFVSLEIPPGIEFDTGKVVAEARRLRAAIDRPNLMVKVPATEEGVAALGQLVAEGVNVNQTLLFDVAVYERSAESYMAGLEERRSAGLPLSAVASVASFFVSRVDTAVDRLLPEASPLRGRVAVANARYAYKRFREIFSGPRWESLARDGARVQRPLWASTSTKNPAYPDLLYVSTLIAPDTVNTVPEKTLKAILDHLEVKPSLVPGIPDAEAVLAELPAAGVDLKAVTAQLLSEGLAAFERDFLALLERLKSALTGAAAPGA